MKKISNERLQALKKLFDNQYIAVAMERENKKDEQAILYKDARNAIQELLDLRERYDRANLDIAHKICELGVEKEYTGRLEEQNRLLVEDSERMEGCIIAMDEAHQKEGKPRSLLAKGVLNLHTALMKQVKGE